MIMRMAIKDGRFVGPKDGHGEWPIEPAELSLLVPSIVEHSAGGPSTVPDVEALGAQIEALLRQAGDRLRRQLDQVHRDREDDRAHDPDLVLVDQRERS